MSLRPYPERRAMNAAPESRTVGAKPARRLPTSPREATTTNSDVHSRGPRPLLRASTTFYDRAITDWWWWEVFSFLISFCCAIAIVGVLLFYDGKRQPQYVIPGITLNAYIALFAAIAKAALILPISEAIGQLKWMWFQKESKLWDFFTFDGASRGPWGALMLLIRTKCRHLASIGAAITLLALAFEPFLQQVVSYPLRETKYGSSAVTVATSYIPDIPYNVDEIYSWTGPGKELSLITNEAILSSDKTTRPAPSVCPTGHCTWDSYASLGVCHKCEDLSTLLKPVCRKGYIYNSNAATQLKNPCGYQVNDTLLVGEFGYRRKDTRGLSTLIVGNRVGWPSGMFYWNSTLFPDARNAIIDFYVAYTPGGDADIRRNATPKLTECLLYWCVKTFNASYSQGILSETLMGSYTEESNTPGYRGQNSSAGGSYFLNVAGKAFEVPENATGVLNKVVHGILPISLDHDARNSTGSYRGMWAFISDPPHSLEPILDKLTTAMTNGIRSQPGGTEKVLGTAWTNENYVQARWVWMTLPVTLMLGAFAFIVTTILLDRRHGRTAWKSSALATLLHGINEDVREQFASARSMSEVEAISRKLRVKLSFRQGEGRLVLAKESGRILACK